MITSDRQPGCPQPEAVEAGEVLIASSGVTGINAPGEVGLLAEDLTPVGVRQPCEYAWTVGRGSWPVRLNTDHEFQSVGGARFVAIHGDGRLIWAVPIFGEAPKAGQIFRVGPSA
jgi:hypothetical protein